MASNQSTESERAVVQVRLTTGDKARVEAAAASQGLSLSEFVRRLIRAEREAPKCDH